MQFSAGYPCSEANALLKYLGEVPLKVLQIRTRRDSTLLHENGSKFVTKFGYPYLSIFTTDVHLHVVQINYVLDQILVCVHLVQRLHLVPQVCTNFLLFNSNSNSIDDIFFLLLTQILLVYVLLMTQQMHKSSTQLHLVMV